LTARFDRSSDSFFSIKAFYVGVRLAQPNQKAPKNGTATRAQKVAKKRYETLLAEALSPLCHGDFQAAAEDKSFLQAVHEAPPGLD
jgi:hypothetical protein